jgi:hypothetical protein
VSIYVVAAQAIGSHHTQVVSGGGDLRAVDLPAGPSAWLGSVESVVLPLLAVFWLSFIIRQAMAWRSADGDRRQQLKWLMSGTAVTMAATGFIAVGGTLNPHASPIFQGVASAAKTGIVALPVCVGVAILKYRLYDIDRIISRTLAYTIVTGLLVGIYVGLVLLVSEVFSGTVAVAAATLTAAALFNPLRRRVQRLVDRRFDRARYDAERVVRAFATRLSGATDLDDARADLLATVHTALGPAHVSLWTVGGSR